MAALRENITLSTPEWTKIEIDPDLNGYVEMEIYQLNRNHSQTQWSPINIETESTDILAKTEKKFDKDIYVKNTDADENNPIILIVTRDNKFDSVTISNNTLVVDQTTVGEQKELIFRTLDENGDGTGNTDMAIDGSTTEVVFRISPPAGEIWRVARWMLYVQDTKGFDVDKWGNGIILTNGIMPRLKQGGITSELLHMAIMTTGDIGALTYDTVLHTFGNTDDILNARWTFTRAGQYVRLIGDYGDELQVVIRDDLTGLSKQYVQVQGYKE